MGKGLCITLSEKIKQDTELGMLIMFTTYTLEIGGSKHSKMLSDYLCVIGFLLHHFIYFLIFLQRGNYKKLFKNHWKYSSK